MNIKTIEWKNNKIKLIDQTRLPGKLEYVYIDKLEELWKAIRDMKIRGAPALGAAAGLGIYLGVCKESTENYKEFLGKIVNVSDYIASSRPTARNLFWAIERMQGTVIKHKNKPVPFIKKELLKEAQGIIEEDRLACRSIAGYAAKLIKQRESILTICNAGILATIDYGTALGIIYRAFQEKKQIKVFSCETRPMLQGARLTTWELKKNGIDVTLICDSMAATLMQQGKIDKVITGADRIALNGDSANKIGTYNLAVLAKYHKIPFYIAAPISTFDSDINSGKDIVIEQRSPKEVTELFFKKPIAAENVKVFNPAFDVTPHVLISGIITDRGILKKPFKKNITKILSD